MTDFKRETAKQRKSLFIAAGHSYSDPGASGHGYTEADIVLDLRDRLCKALRARGVVIGMDGEKGENLPLRQAVEMAKEYDEAIELHCNAFTDPGATGVETLGESSTLAYAICDTVSSTLGIANRGTKGEGSGQHSRLAFVGQADGLIVELFFITNKDDLDRYFKYKDELVAALADTLADQVL